MTAPTSQPETLERELAALGEAPPSAEELALLEDDVEIASVARLVDLAEPFAFDNLSQLETHRGWRTVEQRLARAKSAPAAAHPSETSPVGGGPRRWLFAAIGLAAAAAIALIILRPTTPNSLDPKAVAKMGEQARATLRTLSHGTSDTQRAETLAAEYQQRLAEQGG